MTKGKASGALKRLLDTNKVQIEAIEWVERETQAKEGAPNDS
jgi:hypothetical protein